MKKTMISMALLVLIGTPAAMAQSKTREGRERQRAEVFRKRRSATVSRVRATFRARKISPIRTIPINKEDALLDKKIKSICRGC